MAPRAVILCAIFVTLSRVSHAILGGADTQSKTQFPYVASVRRDNVHICGGSIISPRHILTAAHCATEENNSRIINVDRLSVRVGTTNPNAGGKLLKITDVTIHPEYVDLKNDLAILTLATELIWTDRIQSIAYAKAQTDVPTVGVEVTAAGWGEYNDNHLSPSKLQYTKLTVASSDACRDAFDDYDESVICLAHNKKQGSCRGDAGNGAVYENVLVAVSSFVVGACGARYPDVFVNLPHYSEWIDSVLMENSL